MAIVMSFQSDLISDSFGWDYMAELSYGGNGYEWGPLELLLMTPDYQTTGSHIEWDSNPYDGFDSGWLPAHFDYNESQGLDAGVGGAETTTGVAVSDGIDYVEIRAAVQNQAAMLWRDAVATFSKNGVITEAVPLGSFGVDSLNAPSTQEQIVRVEPTNPDNDAVVVSGSVRLIAPDGSSLFSSDIFSQVFIYT